MIGRFLRWLLYEPPLLDMMKLLAGSNDIDFAFLFVCQGLPNGDLYERWTLKMTKSDTMEVWTRHRARSFSEVTESPHRIVDTATALNREAVELSEILRKCGFWEMSDDSGESGVFDGICYSIAFTDSSRRKHILISNPVNGSRSEKLVLALEEYFASIGEIDPRRKGT